MRSDVVAVVLSGAGAAQGTITLSYPAAVTAQDAQRDLDAIAQVSGWRFSAPSVTAGADETQVVATMAPGARSDSRYGEPLWPIVWALRRFSRIAIAVMGRPDDAAFPISFENRFVTVAAGGGEFLRSYDVTIKDAGFSQLAELRAPGTSAPPATPGSGQSTGGCGAEWVSLLALALALGTIAYLVVARLSRGADDEASRRRAVLALRRGRRARNALR